MTPLGDLTDILRWGQWIVGVICAGSFLVAAGRLGLSLREGEEIAAVRPLFVVMIAALVAGSAIVLANKII